MSYTHRPFVAGAKYTHTHTHTKMALKSQDIPVGIATGYVLGSRNSIPEGARDFSFLHSVQTGSGAHQASCSLGTGGSFPGCKAAGA
jgi:hypothetical protein